jgi:hypothetical protein
LRGWCFWTPSCPKTAIAGDWERIPRTYVFCGERPFGGLFEPFAEAASVERGWDRVDIAGGHEPFITAPEALSRTLLELG